MLYVYIYKYVDIKDVCEDNIYDMYTFLDNETSASLVDGCVVWQEIGHDTTDTTDEGNNLEFTYNVWVILSF